jgi:hypothetical protein
MIRREPSLDKEALRKCWRRWAHIVELFARRRPARKRVDPQAYVELHRELTHMCRVLAPSANEAEATLYRYLEGLVQPWLNLAVLDRAERDILFDLLIRCREVETQLGGRTRIRLLAARGVGFVLASCFFVITLLWLSGSLVSLRTILYRARSWSDELWFNVSHASEVQYLFFVGCALIVVCIYLVSRTARS